MNPPNKPVEFEPTAEDRPITIWLILLMGLLALWAFLYLDGHAGGFNEQVFEPVKSYDELARLQPFDPLRDQLVMGQDVFNHTCATCHGQNGMGKEGQFPPLMDSDWLNAATPVRIGRIVLNGLSGPIQVKSQGKLVSINATMAPLGDAYDDKHLAAALTYVRQQWGNHSSPITEAQLDAIRAASASKKGSWNPDELLKMPLTDESAKK